MESYLLGGLSGLLMMVAFNCLTYAAGEHAEREYRIRRASERSRAAQRAVA
jgi:hypothetical protein